MQYNQNFLAISNNDSCTNIGSQKKSVDSKVIQKFYNQVYQITKQIYKTTSLKSEKKAENVDQIQKIKKDECFKPLSSPLLSSEYSNYSSIQYQQENLNKKVNEYKNTKVMSKYKSAKQFEMFEKLIKMDLSVIKNPDIKRIIHIVIIMIKIIINEYFEMKNFLPKLNCVEFWEFFTPEESKIFFDQESQQISLMMLKDIMKKYFSGKRQHNKGKIRKRKRTTNFTLLFKQSNFTRNGFLKIYQQIQNEVYNQIQSCNINDKKKGFVNIFTKDDPHAKQSFEKFHYKNYTQKTANQLFQSKLFTQKFREYFLRNIEHIYHLFQYYFEQGIQQDNQFEHHLSVQSLSNNMMRDYQTNQINCGRSMVVEKLNQPFINSSLKQPPQFQAPTINLDQVSNNYLDNTQQQKQFPYQYFTMKVGEILQELIYFRMVDKYYFY